ncbi:MAG: cytochrome c3 family protein [Myxococcota bacterium]
MKRSRILLVASSMLATACATFFGLGPLRDGIKTPHERHTKGDVECLACHETIFDSESLATSNLPKESKCMECHKEEKEEKKNCGFCHTNPEKPETFATKSRTLIFDHKKHLEMKEINEDCKVCHKVLPEPGVAQNLAPPMETCTGCHEHEQQFDDGRCDVCHQDLSYYALRPISSFSHKGDFLTGHVPLARSKPESCATCHDQQFCTDCHAKTVSMSLETRFPEKIDRLMVHRGNFLARHTVEQKADPVSCLRCHSTNFCSDCHTRAGLTPEGTPGLNPHGADVNDKTSPNFHGTQARRDIVSCAVCHDQGAASNCVSCHRVGGTGGNPHPPSWLLRHRREEIGQNAMCLTCHQ